jgi:hypothetical protein
VSRALAFAALAGLVLAASVARAGEPPDAGAADAGPADAGATDTGSVTSTCVEHIPEGVTRPLVREDLPKRGVAGYAAELRVVVTHGKGETVLPEGFKLQKSSDAAKGLTDAGFAIPEAEGGTAPTITVQSVDPGTSETTVTIPVVPLPKEPGRKVMVLPRLPIAVWRANNEFVTVCTAPHVILVEDPVANELDPKVKPNPPPRPQREDWPLARNLAIGIPAGAVLALLALWLYGWWTRRPKHVPEAPKIPPWITAIEELHEIRESGLLGEGRTGEYFDRVSDCLRKYLGARYGFDRLDRGYDGLDTTTGEMLDLLRRIRPPIPGLARIKAFLDDCDLVKFARLVPTQADCIETLRRGENIVRTTTPVMTPPAGANQQRRPPPSPGEASP